MKKQCKGLWASKVEKRYKCQRIYYNYIVMATDTSTDFELLYDQLFFKIWTNLNGKLHITEEGNTGVSLLCVVVYSPDFSSNSLIVWTGVWIVISLYKNTINRRPVQSAVCLWPKSAGLYIENGWLDASRLPKTVVQYTFPSVPQGLTHFGCTSKNGRRNTVRSSLAGPREGRDAVTCSNQHVQFWDEKLEGRMRAGLAALLWALRTCGNNQKQLWAWSFPFNEASRCEAWELGCQWKGQFPPPAETKDVWVQGSGEGRGDRRPCFYHQITLS